MQSGDAAGRYFSEPNRLTDKMVALHRMVLSLQRITEVVLTHGLMRTHLDVNYSLDELSEGGGDESKQRGGASPDRSYDIAPSSSLARPRCSGLCTGRPI